MKETKEKQRSSFVHLLLQDADAVGVRGTNGRILGLAFVSAFSTTTTDRDD